MDVQLTELIDKIKAEGVEKADVEASRIRTEAQEQADSILSDARRQAERLISEGKAEVARDRAASEDALRQASRDLILSVQTELSRLFATVVGDATESAFSESVISEAIVTIAGKWAETGTSEIEILLPPDKREAVEKAVRSRLSGQVRDGIVLKAMPGLRTGFRVGERGGNAYFDFSAEGVAEVLSEYLNPRLAGILQSAGGSQG